MVYCNYLCEQAKVQFEHSDDFGSGFEAISQTNLMYFGASQKAEFHTIKAVFLARLNLHKEALQVFNQAVSTDLQYPKAWAQWGAYQDKLFKNSPKNLQLAAGAVNCYLQASGMYKNGKSRKLLIRIFWLIGLDDANGTIGRAFDNYNTLCQDIVDQDSQFVSLGEELLPQRQRAYNAGYRGAITVFNNSANPETNCSQTPSTLAQRDGTSNSGINPSQVVSTLSNHAPQSTSPPAPLPLEHVDDIMGTLKTQFPLLALSMEMLVDQLLQRFEPPPEEEVYRLLCTLLQEALAVGHAIFSSFHRLNNHPHPNQRFEQSSGQKGFRFELATWRNSNYQPVPAPSTDSAPSTTRKEDSFLPMPVDLNGIAESLALHNGTEALNQPAPEQSNHQLIPSPLPEKNAMHGVGSQDNIVQVINLARQLADRIGATAVTSAAKIPDPLSLRQLPRLALPSQKLPRIKPLQAQSRPVWRAATSTRRIIGPSSFQHQRQLFERPPSQNPGQAGINRAPADLEIDPIDPATFLAGVDPSLRETVLLEQDNRFISTLPLNLVAEVDALRYRALHRQHTV
ncbi:hypothetical protein PCANC_02309 [Puccinia coronata f. sp. avenae]|uniref:PIK-related kinase FAT domain-containing protein n=1 Tax=Puccinia coronata f. sp. avenae TaxID=200324 RepID=A0A2N5VZD2_9BASI|nr:hypothetical protein PCANC_02309 [Puccinia coronata f. sp. avenae]